MMRVLLAYGSKYGSTEEVAEEVASVLRLRGDDVDLFDLRRARPGQLEGYDLIIVGTAIIAGSWYKPARKFIESRADDLRGKRLAVFYCGSEPYFEPDRSEEFDRRYLHDVASKHGLEFSKAAYLGGVFDFSRYGLLVRKLLTKMGVTKVLKGAGFDPDTRCDFRDWGRIMQWASTL